MKQLSTKIFFGYLTIILLLSGMIVYFSYQTISHHYYEYAVQELTDLSNTISWQIKPYLLDNKEGNISQIDSVTKLIGSKINNRVTIIQVDGLVLGDSKANAYKMENHKNRPEIIEASNGKISSNKRYSNTVRKEMIYVAVPIYDNSNKIIGFCRVSLFVDFFDNLLFKLRFDIIQIAIITVIFSLVMVMIFSKNISKPINLLSFAARKVAAGDFNVLLKVSYKRDEIEELMDNFNNMTEQLKKLFEKVTNQTEKLNTFFSIIQEGLIVLNSKNEIVLSNISFQKLFNNYKLENVKISKIINENEFLDIISNVRTKKESKTREIQIVGLNFLVSVNYLATTNELVILLHNISDIKKLQSYKKDFIINASHELRTPLTAIKGFVETLEEELEGEQLRYIEIIKRHTDRLINIVNDLLSLSELEQTNINLDVQRLNIKDIIEDIIKLFDQKIKLKNLELNISIENNLSEINGDKFRIEQVIVNLMDNAIKYTDVGSINIDVRTEDINLILEIYDTGIGIPVDDQSRIFERFYIVDKSRSRKVGGTGLGLSIVKHIINLHNGEIILESKVGQGTRFTIKLPLA